MGHRTKIGDAVKSKGRTTKEISTLKLDRSKTASDFVGAIEFRLLEFANVNEIEQRVRKVTGTMIYLNYRAFLEVVN